MEELLDTSLASKYKRENDCKIRDHLILSSLKPSFDDTVVLHKIMEYSVPHQYRFLDWFSKLVSFQPSNQERGSYVISLVSIDHQVLPNVLPYALFSAHCIHPDGRQGRPVSLQLPVRAQALTSLAEEFSGTCGLTFFVGGYGLQYTPFDRSSPMAYRSVPSGPHIYTFTDYDQTILFAGKGMYDSTSYLPKFEVALSEKGVSIV